MKLIHVVPHIDQEASGPSYSVPRLCEALAARGHEVELSCLAAGRAVPGVVLDLHRQWPILRRFAVSPGHTLALRRKARYVDVVHNHSMWSMVNVGAGWVVPGRGAKLVTSPRGTLSDWAMNHSRAVKRALWPLQRRVLERADLLHATCEAEYRNFRALGLDAPVTIIPNGVDLPELPAHKDHAQPYTILYLGRIHPIKGLDRLLHAWQGLQNRHAGWQLLIAGRGEARHEHEIKELAQSLRLQRVLFPGPLYGADKARAYAKASLFVLPSHSENFGMSVAEALTHACPAIVGRGAPWSGLNVEQCGWWVKNDVNSLMHALDAAMQLSPLQRRAMGLRARAWMQRDFAWSSIAAKMAASYLWLLEGGTVPNFVMVD